MSFTTLISAKELLPFLDHPLWTIVDCRFDLFDPEKGEHDYLNAHIPGAAYAHLERDLSAPPTGANGRHPLPTPQQLAVIFSRMGIGSDVQVIAYDDRGGGFASRLWWCLRYLGHQAVALLDGGFPAWQRAGLPTHTGSESCAQRSFASRIQPHMWVDIKQLQSLIGSSDFLLIDARAPERYRGEEEPIDPVAGHIPGAVNRFWQTNLDEEGQFLPSENLHSQYKALFAGTPPQSVIVYCGSGVTSCHNLLAMVYAGLHGGRLYPGSWSEWCADPSRPIEIGEGPYFRIINDHNGSS